MEVGAGRDGPPGGLPASLAVRRLALLSCCPLVVQLDYPPVVVSPLWVEESIKAGRRLVERKYLVGCPQGVDSCAQADSRCAAELVQA